MKLLALLGVVAIAGSPAIVPVPAAPTALSCAADIAQQTTIEVDVADGIDVTDCGETKTVVAEGVSVEIPEPGMGVTAIALGEDGTEEALTVVTDADGVVTASTEEHLEQSTTGARAASVSRCSDTSHALIGAKWYTTPGWGVNSNERRPSNISRATWEKVVADSLWTIKSGRNSCGKNTKPSATGKYALRRAYDSNMNSSNTCTTPDKVSVVDFGSLSGTTLGLTCVAWQTRSSGYDRIVAADIRIDNSSRSWVTSVSGCSGAKYDLRSVLTHEFGHAFGLNHATERGGNDLTMSPSITPCNASARSLGIGDLRGILKLYPQ